MERLDKFLVSQNQGSRKEAAALVRKGAVAVNGTAARDPAAKIDPERDTVTVNGRVVAYREFLTIMMNKPPGVLSATEDSRQPTVLDLLPPELRRRGLFPAGRLDKDTTGLLLITDDGALAHRMLAPRSHVYKLYRATTARPVTEEDIAAFAQGVAQGGQAFAPARLWTEDLPQGPVAWVEIREGKFHQVKRMFQAVGNEVLTLKRCRIGGLWLDETLAPGACRLCTPRELEAIFLGDLSKNDGPDLDFIQSD